MKTLIMSLLFLLTISAHAEKSKFKPNDLVKFLEGEWKTTSVEISADKPIKKETYTETMVAKNENTLTVTAHGIRNGKDLTKDMKLELKDDHLTMSQGAFLANGSREDDVYHVVSENQGLEYRLRLYTLGDKYAFLRETWKNGKILQVDMSYLVRKKTAAKTNKKSVKKN